MKTQWSGRLRTAAAAIAVAVPLVVAGATGPAQAADTWQCSGNAWGFAVNTAGKNNRYPFTAPGTTSAAHGTPVDLGGGWNTYQRVLGGPDSKIYGINANGLFRYRNVGAGWEQVDGVINWKISSDFTLYGGTAWKDKITVDEIGDFYAVDQSGRLRQWRFDEAGRTWTINGRVISTGWDRYNLIFASGPGVIYGRTPDGKLYRSRFEPASQRWLTEHFEVGASSWGQYKTIFGVGGDTFYASRTSTGELVTYRYREDNNTWVVSNRKVGDSGWAAFTNLTGLTNSCKLTDRHEPARPATPYQPGSPIVAIQEQADGTSLGALDYVYADDIGRLRHGYQANPNVFTSVQWSALPNDAGFTGRPALSINPQGKVRMLVHSTSSDAWSFTRQASPSTSWDAGTSLGGALRSRPTVVRLSDTNPVAFGLDADGGLWSRRYSGTEGDVDLFPWRKVNGAGLTGELTAIPGADRKVTLFALDADGTPVTATYLDGTVSAWTELGGSGFTATPAAVKLPGQILRVFARSADGQILTQQQSASGGAFPGSWSAVGDFTSGGPPVAVLDSQTSRLVVVARGADNEVYRVFETAAGSGAWGDWLRLSPDFPDPTVTDPTITPFADGNGDSYLIAFRNQNDAARVYTRQSGSGLAAGKTATPSFTAHTLPAPPR
ncbi:tachylectin-related carbohydrate-binding protein [Actinoplanes sp. NPDC051470]|uniref:tachylectin-related carbohydrate-binding protein n=1 Tax=Actinoplanes sp. NPDC051470 TaxID=3157224 RepID=UPI003443779A